MCTRPFTKVIGSATLGAITQLVIGFFFMLILGCGHDSPPMPITGTTDPSARWVEVKDNKIQQSSLHISERTFAPNVTTIIEFDLPESGFVTLAIYDGESIEVVKPLDRVLLDAGNQSVEFDASNLVSGIYVFTIIVQWVSPDGYPSSNGYAVSKKMILLK